MGQKKHLTRRHFIKKTGKTLAAGLVASFAPALGVMKSKKTGGQKKPNVVFIMADDLGYGDVGFNGHEVIKTPHLDNMAEKGAVLDRFYTASPLCSPTRGSCLTGRHPFRFGVLAAHTEGMRPGEITLPEIFKDQGYATGFFGKWHVGWLRPEAEWSDRGKYSPPWHHGFDVSFGTKSAVPTWNPTMTPDGWNKWGSHEGKPWSGSQYVLNGELVKNNLSGDDSRVIMDRAIPFIKDAVKKDKSFLTCVWFHTPHEPVVAGPRHRAMYKEQSDEKQHYYGCITAMDEQIGRLRKTLKELNIEKDTIVLFTSDNGPARGLVKSGVASAGPYRGSKHTVYEGGLRVPTVIEWPSVIKNKRTDYMSGTVDVLPTLLSLADIENKIDERPLDGINIENAIFSNAEKRPTDMGFGWMRLYKDIKAMAWTSNRYKLIVRPLQKEIELYDLQKDPAESNNLAHERPDIVNRMRKKLKKWEESCRLSRDGNDYRI